MPTSVAQRMYFFQKQIEAKKEELKMLEEELDACRREILADEEKGILPQGFDIIRRNPTRKARASYFREHAFNFYAGHAALSNSEFAKRMAVVCGGKDVAQMRLRDLDTEYFDAHAEITMSDIEAEFGKNLDTLIAEGGIELKPDDKFVLKPSVCIHPGVEGVKGY